MHNRWPLSGRKRPPKSCLHIPIAASVGNPSRMLRPTLKREVSLVNVLSWVSFTLHRYRRLLVATTVRVVGHVFYMFGLRWYHTFVEKSRQASVSVDARAGCLWKSCPSPCVPFSPYAVVGICLWSSVFGAKDHEEFLSHRLNKDVWSNETILTLLRGNFIFWQRNKTLGQARRVLAAGIAYTPLSWELRVDVLF